MDSDPIVDEIHKVRAKIFRKFHGNMRAYFKYLKEREGEHRERLVTVGQLKSRRKSTGRAVSAASGA